MKDLPERFRRLGPVSVVGILAIAFHAVACQKAAQANLSVPKTESPVESPAAEMSPKAKIGSLEIAVSGATPVGFIEPSVAITGGYYVKVLVTNKSAKTVSITSPRGLLVLYSNGKRYECDSAPTAGTGVLGDSGSLAPNQSRDFTLHLPCGITEPGEFEVRAYMELQNTTGSVGEGLIPSKQNFVGSYQLRVQADLDPVRAALPTPATPPSS